VSEQKFSNLPIKEILQDNLVSLNYLEMTAIQLHSLPLMLSGKDVIAQAKTGSGKTVAFSLAILNSIDLTKLDLQALVLCPTRELADQVTTELRKLARKFNNVKVFTLCGGVPKRSQKESIQNGMHIVVGTPGRILDHLESENFNLNNLKFLILDEADRMLDMGFENEIGKIFKECPKNRQTLLFSATYPETIKDLSKHYQKEPIFISTENLEDANEIKEIFYSITKQEKFDLLKKIVLHNQYQSALVFCNTKMEVQKIDEALHNLGFSTIALHGDLEQRDRDQILVRFSNKSACILVATDVAARGLDIKDLEAVFNYDFPIDAETYIHRIGRTGRAGNEGVAYTFISSGDTKKVELLEEKFQKTLPIEFPSKFETAGKKIPKANFVSISIDGGRKDKIRAGDILGALTKDAQIAGDLIGKITLFDSLTYIAINPSVAHDVMIFIANSKIKGKKFKARLFS
jgi:ATP-independent RNA helicase DbpA